MRVNLVSFLDPRVYRGGGEMVSSALLQAGALRGHDIRVVSVRPDHKGAGHAQPDLSLLVDIFNHAHSWRSLGAWRGLSAQLLEDLMARSPYVHFSNAYADVCNLPYLPCSGVRSTDRCPVKPLAPARQLLLRDGGDGCAALKPLVQRMFREARLNVFVSPLHQRISAALLGIDEEKCYALRPLIDTRRFFNAGQKRDIEYLFVGVLSEAKGLSEMRARFAGSDIHLIGRCAPGAQPDFGRHLGHVPYEEVPRYMNRARNFVFLPRWPEPQGRVVVEAALCGCNIIGNDNVGALSFDMDIADPSNYEGVENAFWHKLEGLLN